MGAFSSFFENDEPKLIRPDYANVINKEVIFDNGVLLSYEIPTNLSKLMGYAERYVSESPRVIKVNLLDQQGFEQQGFEQDGWRYAKKIDGGMWNYLGDKKKGLNGELGTCGQV